MENLKQHGEADIVVMLVGNKTDLGEEAREVPTEAGRYLAEQEGFMFTETSAAANSHVRDAFENLLQEIYVQRQRLPQTAPKNPLVLEETSTPKQSGCC